MMGKDATLVRYDAGTFGAGAGFGFCFPPILIGPVPVQICIGGSFRVEGRFAMGYDTSGLRKVLEGGTGTHLLDGIFLDDYDVNGKEVPEVKFIGTVYAEGAVSVYIFKVGIRGEIIFTTALDLHEDQPTGRQAPDRGDHPRLSNPLCLFDVSGKIEAALSAFVEIDLFITSVEFSIEIVRITLLEFKLDVCEPEPPNLARRADGPARAPRMSSSSTWRRARRTCGTSQEEEPERESHRPPDGVVHERTEQRQDALLDHRVRHPGGRVPLDGGQQRHGDCSARTPTRRGHRLAPAAAATRARSPSRTSRTRPCRSG